MKNIAMKFRKYLLIFSLVLFSTISTIAQKKSTLSDGQTRLRMYQQHQDMMASSTMKDLHWQHLGPTNISGRCTDVEAVIPRGQSYTIYVAVSSGGVWKTVNEGVSWEPIFEQAVTTDIGDIAIDPTNPDILWVGTGEANIFRSSMAGCGLYKTTDGGESWEHVGLENTNTIARIIVDPGNTDIVYVAASGHEWTDNKERGIYKTTDGGKTWEQVLYVNDRTGGNDLVMDPTIRMCFTPQHGNASDKNGMIHGQKMIIPGAGYGKARMEGRTGSRSMRDYPRRISVAALGLTCVHPDRR